MIIDKSYNSFGDLEVRVLLPSDKIHIEVYSESSWPTKDQLSELVRYLTERE